MLSGSRCGCTISTLIAHFFLNGIFGDPGDLGDLVCVCVCVCVYVCVVTGISYHLAKESQVPILIQHLLRKNLGVFGQ